MRPDNDERRPGRGSGAVDVHRAGDTPKGTARAKFEFAVVWRAVGRPYPERRVYQSIGAARRFAKSPRMQRPRVVSIHIEQRVVGEWQVVLGPRLDGAPCGCPACARLALSGGAS